MPKQFQNQNKTIKIMLLRHHIALIGSNQAHLTNHPKYKNLTKLTAQPFPSKTLFMSIYHRWQKTAKKITAREDNMNVDLQLKSARLWISRYKVIWRMLCEYNIPACYLLLLTCTYRRHQRYYQLVCFCSFSWLTFTDPDWWLWVSKGTSTTVQWEWLVYWVGIGH